MNNFIFDIINNCLQQQPYSTGLPEYYSANIIAENLRQEKIKNSIPGEVIRNAPEENIIKLGYTL